MDLNTIIGMDKDAALELLQANGVSYRIAHEDGTDYALAVEYRPGSATLSIVGGKIKSAFPG